MSVREVLLKKFMRVVLLPLTLLKNFLLFFVPRRFQKKQPVLPVTNPQSSYTIRTAENAGKTHCEASDELQNWDTDWGPTPDGLQQAATSSSDQQQPDFFQDMQPQVKKAPTMRVKPPPDPATAASSAAEKFIIQSAAAILPQGPELGVWQEPAGQVVAWEHDTWETEMALKENRAAGRRERAVEQHRRRQEKQPSKQCIGHRTVSVPMT